MTERGVDPERRRQRVVVWTSVVFFVACIVVTDTTRLHGWRLYLVDATIALVIYVVAMRFFYPR